MHRQASRSPTHPAGQTPAPPPGPPRAHAQVVPLHANPDPAKCRFWLETQKVFTVIAAAAGKDNGAVSDVGQSAGPACRGIPPCGQHRNAWDRPPSYS